ncbi:hypothetical protein CI109_105391 [Kwoniella shandongensis]|uniref:Uncharacterized protein n=1 Tax=Kwoniella shandongensis TaxID=1734106 RepID=A0A5M6BWE8_9TREE|nr:uncharacterized protein CI109_006308 [Kwoniella shandongensis]KAA5525329.1 hypothetical protein CI109_006308 [Kwoniella shandongensis]
MSFRPTISLLSRQPGVLARTARAPAAGVRSFASSSSRRAGPDDHGHGHGSGSAAEDSDAYTTESFFTPAWRNTFILLTASILIYPYLPSPSSSPISPSLDPDAFKKASKDSSVPYVTRWLAGITPEAKVWKERNDKHLELSREGAETKLLFQEAERPKVWRMRYPSSFEQASPHNVAVGSQADLSGLQIRAE